MTWTIEPRADLSDRSIRRKLDRRLYPYWMLLSYGRHIGFQKRSGSETYWLARYRAKNGWYRQCRLGLTDDRYAKHERSVLTFEQAKDLALEWFRSEPVVLNSGNSWPLGRREELNYCPIGDIYTVGHALRDFFEWKRLIAAESYVRTLQTLIEYYLIPRLAPLPLEEFNGEHLRKFVRDVLETTPRRGGRTRIAHVPLGQLDPDQLRKRKKTINTLIGLLRRAFEMAWENGKTSNERSWRILRQIPNVDVPRMLHLSRPECRQLLSVCAPELKTLVLAALYTGCRCTELVRIQASHVGRDGYGVYITPVKRYRPRFVFLPDEGMQFFLDLAKGKQPSDYLLTRSGGRPWFEGYKRPFKDAIRSAGLPDEFTFHGLRHTYASQLVQAGIPLLVVAEQLGHANAYTVSKTYAHLAPQIRESEVRQRFTVLSPENAQRAQQKRKALDKWRGSLYGSNWRTYADIGAIDAQNPVERERQPRLLDIRSEVTALTSKYVRPSVDDARHRMGVHRATEKRAMRPSRSALGKAR